jgi:hypothetical protein
MPKRLCGTGSNTGNHDTAPPSLAGFAAANVTG